MWIASALAAVALAQDPAVPELNAQNFRPSIDARRMLGTDDTALGPELSPTARVLLHYTHDPLVYELAETEERVALLSNLLQANILAGVRYSRLRLGLDAPVFLLASGDLGGGGGGLGDLALDARGVLLERGELPLGLGLSGRLSLPTATLTVPVGSAGLTWELAAIADVELGPVLLAANLGTRGTPAQELENIEVNDQFVFRTGAGYAITEDLGASAELSGQLAYSAPLSNAAAAPMEWLLGGWGRLGRDVVLRGGAGAGITPGIGAPDFRLLASVGYEPENDRDVDGDGLLDRDDLCPLDAEDRDGWEDADGCPEIDNDADGLVDRQDACPDQPEDLDTWRDADGCPDPEVELMVRMLDPSGELVDLVKVVVRGPDNVAGSAEFRHEVGAGEYLLTARAPGYAPLEYRFDLEDGPPVVIERVMEPVESDVVVSRERIDLEESIYFETGSAVIKVESHGLLDQVVEILEDYPEIARLRIEGHTDSRGPAAANLALSRERAAAVRQYLIEGGIEPERLSSEGHGETRPLDERELPEAWERNRRVDLVVESWVDG